MARNLYIIWKDEYSVSHDELDRHHQYLFTVINELYEAMGSSSPSAKITLLLKNALEYAQMHFEAEEKVMSLAQYPHLVEQENAHRTYARRVEELMSQSRVTPSVLSEDLLLFLKEWWLNHILKMDKAYAPYLKKQS